MTRIHYRDWMTIPTAIVIAGVCVGAGIYFGAREIAQSGAFAGANLAAPVPTSAQALSKTTKIAPITAKDHIRGNVNAKVIVVEYSDYECPYCKRYHDTMKQISTKFSKSDVAWVYRHFPLPIHPNAKKEAEASECAAELGGNAKFWEFSDRLFEVSPGNNKFNLSELPNIAEYIGLDKKAFETCLASGKYAEKIAASISEGSAAGVRGTPYSVLVTSKSTQSINGAVPYEQLEAKIKEALAK